MAEKIKVIFILEILGKPPNYIKEAMEKIIENIGKEKDLKIIQSKIAEPKKVEEEKIEGKDEVFTTFSEIEFETSLQKLMLLIFAYMPSHIEILEPEELKIKNFDLNGFFNELARKLHQYDEIANAILIEKEILANKIKSGEIKFEIADNAADKKTARKKKK